MKKILLILVSFIFLEGCAQTTALLGPAITIGSTGNVMQAGLSYGSNMAIKQKTGKTTVEHVSSYVEEEKKKKNSKKLQKKMQTYLEEHIAMMKVKLAKKN